MSGLCGRDCEKCVMKERCGGCSFCEASLCIKDCKRCSALCPKRPTAISYLKSIGGAEINVVGNKKLDVKEHIPILPDRFKFKPDFNLMPVIGIHGGNMFSRNGERIIPSYLEHGYAKALNIDDKTEAILEFYVKDRTLEGFWDNRKNIYSDLKKMNFKAVISPNFSVYEDAPRLDHIYNIKRSTVVYNEMMDFGINAIPDVSWYNKNDLDRWIRDINKNKVNTIAFSFQVVDVQLKASTIWKNYILGFRYLCKNIGPGVKILVIGSSSPRRAEEIYNAAAGQSISILNQAAFVQSRRGMLSEGRVSNKDLSKDEIFERNITYFNEVYEKLNRQHVKDEEEYICQNLGLAIL